MIILYCVCTFFFFFLIFNVVHFKNPRVAREAPTTNLGIGLGRPCSHAHTHAHTRIAHTQTCMRHISLDHTGVRGGPPGFGRCRRHPSHRRLGQARRRCRAPSRQFARSHPVAQDAPYPR